MSTKQLSLEKPLFILSLISCLYWTISQILNVYTYALAGALYEILWLPMVLMLVGIPVVAAIQLIKKSSHFRSYYLMALLLSMLTLLYIWLA
jgi:hypothetical protein